MTEQEKFDTTEQTEANVSNTLESVCGEETVEINAPAETEIEVAEDAVQETTVLKYTTRLEVVEQLELIVKGEVDSIKEEVDYLKQQYYKLKKQELDAEQAEETQEGAEQEAAPKETQQIDELEQRLKESLHIYKEKRAEQIAAQEAERAANLAKKEGVLSEMQSLINDSDNINKRYAEFQQLQQNFKDITDVPASAVTTLWKTYQYNVEQFYDMLKINKELRDYDFKKNLEQKQALCAAVEALVAKDEVINSFKELQHLHNEWREIGPVERELREEIWSRFKDASTEISKRYQAHFEQIKEIEKNNEEAKVALCEKIEALDITAVKNFQEWEDKTKEIIELQAQWKTVGFASRKVNTQLFERFRKKCDEFFTAKSDYYKEAKDTFSKNLAQKRELCEKAEQLKDSTEWNKTADKLIALQKEWKTIGAVPKKYSDPLWKRFVGACDYFFEQKGKETSAQREVETANLEAKKAIIEKIKAISDNQTKQEAETQIRALMSEWNSIGFVPFRDKDKLNKQYREEIDRRYEQFSIKNREERLNNYKSNLKSMTEGGESKLMSERNKLMRTYDRMKLELQTFENNLGFLSVSSKQGSILLKDIEKKIKKLKDDMALVVKKIEVIDQSIN